MKINSKNCNLTELSSLQCSTEVRIFIIIKLTDVYFELLSFPPIKIVTITICKKEQIK